jgi:type IVB pilus formation R64 PilN family outer membrane protein
MPILLRYILILVILASTGCSSPLYEKSLQANQTTQNKITQSKMLYQRSPVVIEKDEIYADLNPVSLTQQPSWLQQKVNISGDQLPFYYYVQRILRKTSVNIQYDTRPPQSIYRTLLEWATHDKFDPGINIPLDKKINFHYIGSVKGALDRLAAQTNTYYFIQDNNVIWSRFETKTFEIPFLPNTTKKSTSSVANIADSVEQTTQSNLLDRFPVLKQKLQSYTGQSTSVPSVKEEDTNMWKDMAHSVKVLLSSVGAMYVSETNATITVRDYPANVQMVAKYIDKIKKTYGSQVRLDIEVLELSLNDGFSYGINWDLFANFLSNQVNIGISGDSRLPLDNLSANSFLLNVNSGPWENTKMIIDALSQQGQVSVVTQPSVVSLNAQPAIINITEQQAYLSSITQKSFDSLLQNPISLELTPGNIDTGFKLYVLPRIIDKEVYLQLKWSIAALTSLDSYTAETSNTANKQELKIQLPRTSTKEFDQKSFVHSGSTLILAGFKQIRHTADQREFFNSQALGGKRANNKNVQTVILITPTIIRSSLINTND